MNIAIQGVPRKWSLKQVRAHFMHDIPCQFKTLYFDFENKFNKTVYIELLSDQHDLIQITRLLNRDPKNKALQLKAVIPRYVSQAHIGASAKAKGKAKGKEGPKRKDQGDVVSGSDQVMIITHKEIMTELQSKYTRLYNLSRKSPDNKLLDNIAQTIFERLKLIMDANPDVSQSCFKLSGYYRKLHPHFGDFQMILSTLHKLQDEHGVPRSELVESEVAAVSSQLNMIDNIPFNKIQSVTEKYSMLITKRVLEHVRKLDTEEHQMDTPEVAARKKVRLQLKNMAMHLPSMIKQVIQRQLTPEKAPFHRVRVYGEPFLPPKDTMEPFIRRFKAVHVQRSDRMFNLIKMNIPPALYSNLMAKDGTTVGNAKLVIRSSDIPLYKLPDSLVAEMKAHFEVGHDTSNDYESQKQEVCA